MDNDDQDVGTRGRSGSSSSDDTTAVQMMPFSSPPDLFVISPVDYKQKSVEIEGSLALQTVERMCNVLVILFAI